MLKKIAFGATGLLVVVGLLALVVPPADTDTSPTQEESSRSQQQEASEEESSTNRSLGQADETAATKTDTAATETASKALPSQDDSQNAHHQDTRSTAESVDGEANVYFFDVGQADATLFDGPECNVLIDAGDYRSDDVVPYLESVDVTSLDYLIGTHPHADHIGQFPQVLNTISVEEVWLSGDSHTSNTFERALDAIEASNAGYHEPRAGETFSCGSTELEVANPDSLTGDLHEGSVSVRIVYGETRFLFTGDAEAETEREMVTRDHSLDAEILQLGHHGSRTSSSRQFLQAVSPEIAIYSAGEDNQYGHPHQETIDRLTTMDIPVYGTPVHGTIEVTTDGTTHRIETEHDEPPIEEPGDDEESEGSDPSGCSPGQVDVNSAPKEDLTKIIHIGDIRAEELIELRPFSSLDDLTRIDGIGPSRLEDIKEQGVACIGN